MDNLVRNAHRELDEEVHRLTLAYQSTMQQAHLEYERGIIQAQLKFESKLHASVTAMTSALEEALTR
jgi:hypothetical protein